MVATRGKEQRARRINDANGAEEVYNANIDGQTKLTGAKYTSKKSRGSVEKSTVDNENEAKGSNKKAIGPRKAGQIVGSTNFDQKIPVSESASSHVQRGKHKRFDDPDHLGVEDDIAELEPLERKALPIEAGEHSAQEGSAVESDDEAPEEVTVATGEAQAKAAAAAKAKNLKKQADDRKAKRKKRDHDLKEQARTSKKRKISQVQDQDRDHDSSDASSLPDQPNSLNRDSVNELAKSLLQSEGPLPAYLPDEIFAIEPESRPEMPLPVRTKLPKSQDPGQEERSKRRRLDVQFKPVKDVKRGNTRVRVLPQLSSALPPPVVKRSAKIREQWLKDGMKRVKIPGYRQTGARSFLRR